MVIYATLPDGSLLGLRCALNEVSDFGTLQAALREAAATALKRSRGAAAAAQLTAAPLEVECLQSLGGAPEPVTSTSCSLQALRSATAIRVSLKT